MHPTTIPHGRTARRVEWSFLPPALRAQVERRLGSPVVEARSQRAGFTPGMASVLVCADGSRHFVKAASVKAQRPFAEAYRAEARTLAALPAATPSPRLRWVHDDGDWVVLAIEHVEARAPRRPWTPADLDAALAALARAAQTLTAAPDGPAVVAGAADFATEFAGFPAYWDSLRRSLPDLRHREEAALLAGRFREVTAGSTLVHTDVRDDNLLVRPDGSVLVCDWNWPALGAPWIDSLLLLIGPRGDGLDVEAVLATHPTFAGVAPEAVDIVLALVTGYFLKSAGDPVPATSPHLREAQWWQGDVCWHWLSERRGWE
ncbi:phosphotransferase [Nocardioides sp. Leaf285]|uniref:phosphotransferase n=1 Tax=Nocardioides sp. Leaf285 TaxID=1736322 RepID=UPI0007036B81|nr:phosphotransferase [Nocardioides sp. Leaf285]KQP64643.1 hypothetical protein ASF47_11960 [Nocardioides sp. Leaf285]